MSSNDEVEKILSSIFLFLGKKNPKSLPILNSLKEIPQLIIFLKDNNQSIDKKMALLSTLVSIFKTNENIIPSFMRKFLHKSNEYIFFEPLIDLYIIPSLKKEYESLLEELFSIILTRVNITKDALEYLYQKLSLYFSNKEKEKLTESILLKYLELLKLFYSDLSKTTQTENQIKNYMYFNGNNSALTFSLNKSTININSDFPTFEQGLSFVFWCFIKKELITQFYESDPKNRFKFVVIDISGNQISLVLNDTNNMKLTIDDNQSTIINVKSAIKYDDWNSICFTIKPKSSLMFDFNVNINGKDNNSILPITKGLDISKKINSITLFQNFIGLSTSALFFSFELKSSQIKYFNSLKHGFDKNKKLYEFFCKNNKGYLSNGDNQHKFANKIKVDKQLNLFDFSLKNQNIKNCICFLCPFTYNKEENVIDDIFGNFIGKLSENDGVNNYKKNAKSIKSLGGMNTLLPIIELMYSTISKAKDIKYNNIDKNILSENTFLKFFSILNTILLEREKNMEDANKRQFFANLSLFLEKFPSNVYTDEILKIFLDIGKDVFQKNETKEKNNFINVILLNETIFSKFSIENQLKLWEYILKFYDSDYSQLKDSLNMTKICMILRFYDNKRYNEYCCMEHANLFKPKDSKEKYTPKVMYPELNSKLHNLFGVIQIYLEKLSNDEEISNLYKLLSMDLSPCLQKKIIKLFYSLFQKEKIPANDRKKFLDDLLKNNFLEISEYVLCFSLLDVRIELLKLIKLLIDNKDLSETFNKYLTNMRGDDALNQLHHFISVNIVPDELTVETSPNKKEKLLKYFNNDIYNKDLELIFNQLLKWSLEKTGNSKQKGNESVSISKTYMNYCLLFASRAPDKFVHQFIESFFQNNAIKDKSLLKSSEYIYHWVIETIFYFYNKENEDQIDTKEAKIIINKINEIFVNFFFENKQIKDVDKFVSRTGYILKYSYKLKSILKDEPKKIEETSRITRFLFEELLEKVPKNTNEIINLCYEYIILYKNKEKLSEIKKNLTEEFKNIIINLNNLNINKVNLGSKENESNIKHSGNMPSYIYSGLNVNKIEDGKKYILKDIWKDCKLYESIIDYYSSNLWGTENLCKKVNVEYNGDPLRLCKDLLKAYGDNKTHRNKLTDDVLKYFNLRRVDPKDNSSKINEEDLKNMKNIFNINLILLCVAMDITQDEDERNFIIGLYHQFLIYLVMVSINISPQDQCHDFIQDKIYVALGFGIQFLNKRNKEKYNEIINELFNPIFEAIFAESSKKKIKTLFTGKKNLFKDTAVIKLFKIDEKASEVKAQPTDKKSKSSNANPEVKISIVFKGEILRILKNIFENDLLTEKLDSNQEEKIVSFYKKYNDSTINGIYEMDNNEEKHTMFKKIEKFVASFENQIKNYSNSSFLQEKKRRNEYKWTKKRLFSWRGFWSDRDLFFKHPENLKLKQKNHLTKDMTMPLLVPILDMDYYLPDFGKFDKKNLFNGGDCNYKISLDIDDILRDEMDETIENNKKNKDNKGNKDNKTNKIDDLNFTKNNYNFNYLESIYKSVNEKIWEKYKLYYDHNFNYNKIILENKVIFGMFQGSRTISKSIKEQLIENQYNCCMVKPTHHIKGYVCVEKTGIKFCFDPDSRKNDTNETLENDPTYDRDMDCCFGSTFKTNKRDKDKINFIINYDEIKYMFPRNYFYLESGIEIYTRNLKVYFFNFKIEDDLANFKKDVLSHSNDKFAFREIKTEDYKGKKILGYEVINPANKSKEYNIISKTQDWQCNNISTLEYLMWLNIYAGRSFNDLTIYPVFPWLVTNYSSNELDSKKDYRDLSLPMGMLELSDKGKTRKETFMDTYDMVKNDLKENFPDFNYSDFLKKQDEYYENYRKKKNENKEMKLDVNHLPYYYGSHYSNPTYISHYLSRSFPYALVAIEIQGEKFDDPDRLFLSMNKTFISASSLKDDVRELIPEFYLIPEILLNKNNLNLDQGKTGADNKKSSINDVELPPWSKNNACILVTEMRRILETGDLKLNKWIDLIFGSCQRGEKAEEKKNLFKAHSYERMVKDKDVIDPESRDALMRLNEMGVTPLQIFASDTKPKFDKKQILEKSSLFLNAKGTFIYEKKELTCKKMKLNNFNTIKKKLYENDKLSKKKEEYTLDKNNYGNIRIIKMKQIEHNNLKVYTNTNQWYNIKYSPNSKDLSVEESNLNDIDNNSSKFANSYTINNEEFPLIIYDKGKYLLKGGFWDGRIERNSLITEKKDEIFSKTYFNNIGGCITIMEMTKKENVLLCGTKEGCLLTFKVDKSNIELVNSLFIHSEPIVSISINDRLNMCATSSKDGYVMIYTFPAFDLIRSIHIPSLFKDESEFLYADNIFLSNSPLPCITVFISKKRLFKIFTINGHFMQDLEEDKEVNSIKNPFVFTSFDFQDYLIYGTNNGLVKIRRFPEMELVNQANPFNNNKSIECLCLSLDNRYCFAWSSSNEIAVISNCFSK